MAPLRWCVLAGVLGLTPPLLPTAGLASQAPLGAAPSPLRFDVVAIHPSRPEENGFIKPLAGGHGYTAVNIPVKLMISLMYRIPMREIEGGPDWLNTERFDVEARVDGVYSVDDLHVMYQNLLADRFNLKFHKEFRQGNAYTLTVDKSGSKLKLSQSEQKYDIPMNFGPGGSVAGTRVSMSYFCWWLAGQLQRDARPVIDQTGLDKFYDFTLSFAPELPPDVNAANLPPELADRPSLFDALREQLGLKLTPQKAEVPYYVIDHVEKPSPN